MARSNTSSATVRKGVGPISTTGTTLNAKGVQGFKRDAKSELFLAAVTSFNEDSFYESASARQNRIADLAAQVAKDGEWLKGLVNYLRNDVGLRSIPTVVAVEAVNARLTAGISSGNREIIAAAIGRADEASDVLAYWMSNFGRRIPSAVKRGVSDALNKTLNENSFLKWRGRASNGAVSLRDVINLTHPVPKDAKQDALYGAVIADAYGRKVDDSLLPVVKTRNEFLALSEKDKLKALTFSTSTVIKDARLTHEVIAGALGKIPAKVWEKLVPSMGYQALRMNLRRISEAGVSYETIEFINRVLADKDAVAKSRTMPINFLAAYRNAPLDFAAALQRGANGALENVPALSGRTLILIDNSYSMADPLSERSSLTRNDAANVFGAALAIRAEKADVYAYNNDTTRLNIKNGDLLPVAESFPRPRGGTSTKKAVRETYKNHDRVILLTDEQNGYNSYYGAQSQDVFEGIVPANVPAFTWNLAGYEAGHAAEKPGRFTFGGLTDKGFEMIPLIERGFNFGWSWE